MNSSPDQPAPARRPQGFAAISPERQREIASMGGKSVKPEQRAYSRDRDLAVRSGQLGAPAAAEVKRERRRRREGTV